MENKTLKNIMHFLENEENHNPPFLWKVLNNDPFTEDELNIKGNLDLSETKIRTLPKGLKVGGALIIVRTNFTNFSDEELREMIKPGFIRGKIYRL
jgi:hypothetical protein